MSAATTTSRPRQRRAGSAGLGDDGSKSRSTSTSLLAAGPTSSSSSRRVSPTPSSRNPSSSRASDTSPWIVGGGGASSSSLGKGLWDSGLAPAWASVQGFASSILSGESPYGSDTDRQEENNRNRARRPTHRLEHTSPRQAPEAWGPEPPSSKQKPRLDDVAAGSMAEREAALKARRTASVLESHEGVNGGLDVAGKFKRRSSDENLRGSNATQSQEPEEYLAYIHHVQPSDTYAGIVLKYRCREDAFRKANGLWSRDNIQIRNFLVIPVDACEIKGRTCGPPTYYSQDVDLLATTPGKGGSSKDVDDFFSPSPNGKVAEQPPPMEDAHPWTHVRWVALESFKTPVEIARVSRRSTGYFPPRRKKSVHTNTTLSTPRGSVDLPGINLAESIDSPSSTSSRRLSGLSNRPQGAGHAYSASVPSPSSRSRGGSVGQDEHRPAWMRRPGGVGSLGKTVRAPGPEKDYFNLFARKHFPGIGIDSLPSMSVMGSETARFGFDPEANGIVESPFEGGRDATSAAAAAAAAGNNGTGLEQAAATVEMWLRGAFAKRSSGSMSPGLRRQTQQQQQSHARHSSDFDTTGYSDLIELEDTNSDDGRPGGPVSLLSSSGNAAGTSSRSGGDNSALRGRMTAGGGGVGKGKKAD